MQTHFSPKTFLYVTSGLLLALSLYINFNMGFVGDRGYLLFAARQLVEGKTLYVDIFDITPPLVLYLYTAPVYLAKKLGGLADYEYMILIAYGVVMGVGAILYRLIALHPLLHQSRKKQLLFCWFLLFVFIEFHRPTYFFDRDYLFLLFAFPYLFLHQPSLSGTTPSRLLQIWIGLAAGIGFCMKPYCLIVFAAVQLLYWLRNGHIRIVFSLPNLIIYFMGISYLAFIWCYTPQYLHIIVPMAMLTYAKGREIWFQKLAFLGVSLFWFGVVFSDFRLRYNSVYRKDILYFTSLLPAFLCYALINGPWGYVWNVVNCMIMFIAGLLWLEFRSLKQHAVAGNLPCKPYVFGMRSTGAAIAVYALIYVLYAFLFFTSCNTYECTNGKAFLEQVKSANEGKLPETFGTLHTSFDIWVDLVRETDAHWVTRFDHLWMLPQFLAADTAFKEKNRWVPEYVANGYADDLNTSKPELVFVSDSDTFLEYPHYVNLVDYLSAFPNFKEAWSHYEFIREVNSPVMPLSGFIAHTPRDAETTDKNRNGYYVYKRKQ